MCGNASVVIMDNLKASLFQKIKYASVQHKHRSEEQHLEFHHRKIIEGGTKGELKPAGTQEEVPPMLACMLTTAVPPWAQTLVP